MKLRNRLIALLLGLAPLAPAAAQDSVTRGSNASVGASLLTGPAVAWIAHEGSEFTVKAIRATAHGIELSLQGASTAIETSALVTKEALESAAVGVGTAVSVVADASGYALVAAGHVIAYIPRSLLHHSRH